MRISNETKVGALTVIAVTLLVLGYNFLKGTSVTRKTSVIYAKFNDVGALEISNPVKIKGFRIGNVADISSSDEKVSEVIVTINLNEQVKMPANSVATIINSLTGSSSIFIMPGNATSYIELGDTLTTTQNPDILSKVMSNIDPLLISVKHAVDTLQRLLVGFNNMLDLPTQTHFRSIIKELDASSQNLSYMLNPETGALASTLNNTNTFTQNLNKNNENINEIIAQFKSTSQQLSQTKIKETVDQLNGTLLEMQTVLQKTKSTDGTVGLLLNDPKLYNNLQQTSRSLNTLLDDLKTHPKRYVSFSVFGKKDKSQPLSAPLSDTIQPQQR